MTDCWSLGDSCIFISVATVIAIVNRSMSPENKADLVDCDLCAYVWSITLYIMFGESADFNKTNNSIGFRLLLQEKHEDSLHQNLRNR